MRLETNSFVILNAAIYLGLLSTLLQLRDPLHLGLYLEHSLLCSLLGLQPLKLMFSVTQSFHMMMEYVVCIDRCMLRNGRAILGYL